MTDRPTVGRVVHFVAAGHSLGTYQSTCRAAIVTSVKDETTVSLAVFMQFGQAFYTDLTYDVGKAGATWHWPEREDVPTSSIHPAGYTPPLRGSDSGGSAPA